jgi:hypothetical protein
VRAQLVMTVLTIAACGGAEPRAAEPAPAPEVPPAPAAVAPPPEPEPPPAPEPPQPPARSSKSVPADMSPGSDPSNVRAVIKANISQITACYEDVLNKKPGLQGTVHTTFTIASDGRVESADAVGVDGAVDACIIYVLESLRFPAPKQAPLVIKYPFTFRPNDPAATPAP